MWWLRVIVTHLYSHMTLFSPGHITLHDKLKALCFHFYKIYNHQALKSRGLRLEATSYQVMLPIDYKFIYEKLR